jgi:formate hydrogenlyase transcriptional activator
LSAERSENPCAERNEHSNAERSERVRDPSPRRAEAAMMRGGDVAMVQALRRKLELVFEGQRDAVYAVDRNGRTTLVTPSLMALTGHSEAEMLGRSPHEILHHSHSNGERYPVECCPIFSACRDGRREHAHEVFCHKDGSSIAVDYTTAPLLQGAARVGSVVVVRELEPRSERRDRLNEVLAYLSPEAADVGAGPTLGPVGVSAAWLAAMELVRRVAAFDTSVLLLGESGTGKELVARELHEKSGRRSEPFVTVNCAAVPQALLESELFGHERGAFTGAISQRIGRFEQAGRGTLFLDEIGELPLEAQAKLLRVLQARVFERVGGTRGIRSDARIVAATNRDLKAMVGAGEFRLDLYYRLGVFPIRLPPLRERMDDIPVLVDHFLARLEPKLGRRLQGFTQAAERGLRAHHWPGNVRELENVVERAALMVDGALLDLPEFDGITPPAPRSEPLARSERLPDRRAVVTALERSAWKVSGARGAAAELQLHPNTLRRLMRRLTIERPRT